MLKQSKKRDCGCSGHPSGRPKLTHGPCYGYGVRAAVKERIRGKRIARVWLEARDVDDVDE
jgi:hypothetical protein